MRGYVLIARTMPWEAHAHVWVCLFFVFSQLRNTCLHY